ncbi:hypothetical protein [Pilimelia columellifera]|uniref:Uncharacterized protein n=1 Tax=Pilimelia columellifera subsp. columellifera TaxID=706583 RepID=A0ABP6B0E3_9ACTN
MGKRQRKFERNSQPEQVAQGSLTPGQLETEEYIYEVLPTPDLSPEQGRAAAVAGIGAVGMQRLRLLGELDGLDQILRPRVHAAIEAGVPYRRITELTGYSRSTLSRWAQGGDSTDI